jgi:hypothetical protein
MKGWKIKMKRTIGGEEYLQNEHKEYIGNTFGLTKKEKKELLKWVKGGNSVYENPYSMSDEYGRPMDFIDVMRVGKELMKEYLQDEFKEYLSKTNGLTTEQKKELRKWVRAGNSVYENPYQISDESGCEMNYIDAVGFYEELENDFLE